MSQQLPSSLLASLQTVNGFDEKSFVEVHESGEQVTSIRVNPAKSVLQNAEFRITAPVLWTSNGYYLEERPSFTVDPLFHAGAYYVQEASSMFLEEVIRQTCDLSRDLKVLDLCAAPGGKSTLLQSVISENSLLVSNEVIKTRVNVLTENITKWGAANVVITNNDPKDFQRLSNYFDVIVIDAPCSGSGLFRRDPGAITEWSIDNVAMCSLRQQRILADILPSLKPGGILIYSTCSYSKEEDENICDWLLSGSQYPVTNIRLQLKTEWNIIESTAQKSHSYGYRFYPDKVKGEGFFVAAFRKEDSKGFFKEEKIKDKPLPVSKTEMEVLGSVLKDAKSFSFLKWQEDFLAIPSGIFKDVLLLQSVLYLKKAGIKTGTIIRNELIPDHELAMSGMLNDTVPCISADLETSLQYLRKREINPGTECRGWTLLKYKTLPLGWIKILQNRVNNYYPREWRILNK